MEYRDKKVKDIVITYIGGGSRGWAWSLMTDLANEPRLSGVVKLYDIDFHAAQNNEKIGNLYSSMEGAQGKWTYQAIPKLEEALQDSDFVIISILPGTFREMWSDVHAPEQYGIFQSVGDTAGPGGMIRALRTIPMFVTIAEAIKSISPKAWVINYTNPMSLCVKTLYHTFPEIKAFGCCHEVFTTQALLATMCSKAFDIEKIQRDEIHVNVLGINHFTWFNEASYQGYDLFPIWKDFVMQHYEEGFEENHKNWANSTFDSAHRVKFDLYKRFGYIAAAGDRHLAEFMPSCDYLKDPDTVRSWKFGLTTVQWRIEDMKRRFERSAKLIQGEEKPNLTQSGEEGVLLIKALLGMERVISNVNMPNRGQIANLPMDAVVETNAVFSRDSIKPVIVGSIPENILELTLPHVINHDLILKAAIDCRIDFVEQAFSKDPLVKGRGCSIKEVKSLVKTMIRNTLQYLQEEWNQEDGIIKMR